MTLPTSGDAAFAQMWRSIEDAKHSIHMETYILRIDSVGARTLELLENAARRGVKVSLVYDSVGYLNQTYLVSTKRKNA